MNFDSPDAFLAHVLWTFRPYLDRLVLVGGFAVRLYELHPRASQATIRVLRTFDADFATANDRIPVVGESLTGLAEAAGFRRDFRGDHAPPVIKLVPKEAPAGPSGVDQYTIEFLSPLTGAPASRSGRVAATSDIQEGLTAQRLRYLDLLLEMPWSVSLAGLPGIPKEYQAISVSLPHPGLFIVQKILIAKEPNRLDKRPKDMAYVYHVVSLFRSELNSLADDVRDRMGANPAWRSWLGRFKRLAFSLFADPVALGVTEAHRVLQAGMAGSSLEVPSPQMNHAGVTLFLERL